MNTSSSSNQQQIFLLLQLCTLIGMLLFGLSACSDNDPLNEGNNNGHTGKNLILNNITFMREDSTALAMSYNYAICCAIWEPGHIDKNTLKIFFYDPLLWSDPSNAKSFWKLFIIVDEIGLETPYSFPVSLDDPIRVFLMDVTCGNELSGAEEESSGIITIDRLTCGSPLQITFSIDAIIGSEFHLLPGVNVTGTFSATVYSNPSPFGCGFSM